MINWIYFPQNRIIETHLQKIIKVFENNQEIIASEQTMNLKSDEVLAVIASDLEDVGYQVEKSKKSMDLIRVPVLFGRNGKINLAFEVDAYSKESQTVIEVEAGRGVANYQFLKDYYESCMMQDVKYFCVAVKNEYKTKEKKTGKVKISYDFEKVCSFFETLYLSGKVITPLEGVLVIGY